MLEVTERLTSSGVETERLTDDKYIISSYIAVALRLGLDPVVVLRRMVFKALPWYVRLFKIVLSYNAH
jgi:hypothetical protein